MVHELALDGTVVRLSSLSLPDDSDNSQVCMHSSNLHISLISIFFCFNFRVQRSVWRQCSLLRMWTSCKNCQKVWIRPSMLTLGWVK